MKFILSLFSFFLLFSCSCTEKFIIKDQISENHDCKSGEIKEIENERFICVRTDANCYCNYNYRCVQDSDDCKEFNRHDDGRPCPLNARCDWVSNCYWITKRNPDIKECSTVDFEKLFGICWCRMLIVDKSCAGKTINQTIWLKLE